MDFSEYQTEIIEDIKSCLEGLQVQPILFMGAGVSQRYLKAPDWENLLKYLAETCPLITRPYGYYSQTRNDNKPMIASDFSESYAEWAWDVGTSRYPEQYFNGKSSKDIYIKHEIATLLNNLSDSVDFSAMEYTEEIEKLKKVRPHAIITTNYDDLLEKIFDNYQPIVGHNVVTVNYTTYGEIMKIHGSSKEPESIIITNEDYVEFYKRKKYISAKLLTYFVEHPLFFIGYSINDENIKAILSDIDEIIAPNNALIPNIYLFAEEYMADYNRRFAKEPLHDFNAYRPLALDDDLDAEFTWREPRRVSKNLTVQYDKMLYLIEDNEYSRRAIGKYIDVWHYPDGHKELRLNGVLLPYSTYDRLSEVEPVAIVDNKRLGHVLDVARQVQRKRDNNRSLSLPCSGDEPSRRRHAPSINKSQRSLNEDDLLETMIKLQGSSEAIFGKR
ncbi:SIR2 family protein [Escherichia coli]